MRNPTRRSRKIGLTQGGRVKYGKAEEKWSKMFPKDTWEKLSNCSEGLRIIRENPSKHYFHPTGAIDIRAALDRLPTELTRDVRAIILRRTPKKDENNYIEARRRYYCIILNAFPRDMKMHWSDKVSSAQKKHMEYWCNNWIIKDNDIILQWSKEELKRYYLYHLLLHELGHINDYRNNSSRSRESFAEDFALEWARKLGELPNKPLEST